MTLDARRIALKGVGYSPLIFALKGFVPDGEVAVQPPPFRRTLKRKRRDTDDDALLFLLR